MAAKWKWGTVDIFASDYDTEREVKRAELQVLDATDSTFHYFGASSRRLNVKGLVVGETNRNSIETDAIYNTTKVLTTPWETIASCYIDGTPKFSAKKYSGGVIDGTSYSVETTPIYEVDLNIIIVQVIV